MDWTLFLSLVIGWIVVAVPLYYYGLYIGAKRAAATIVNHMTYQERMTLYKKMGGK